MTDAVVDPVLPSAPVAPAAAPAAVPAAPAPVVSAPVAPAESAPVAPAPDAAAVAAPESSVGKPPEQTPSAPAAASPPTHPAEEPTLLEKFGKKDGAPEAKPEDAKPGEPAPVVEPAKIDWKFEFPETLKADDAQIGKFTGILDNLLHLKEGETPNQVAQRLIDLHNEALVTYDKQMLENQVRVFNSTRKEWEKQAKADPMIGGAGHDTSMGVIARMRDMFVSDAKPGTPQYAADEKELNNFLRITGAGDHPAFLKMLYRVGNFFDEPRAPAPGAKPSPNNGKPVGGRSLYKNGGTSPASSR
jgi:hypothetical protein